MAVILIIDSDPKVCEFAETGFPIDDCVIGAPSWEDALEVLEDITFDIVLLDGKLSGLYKFNLIDQVRRLQGCPILLFAEGDPSHLETLSQGIMADGYVEKILDSKHVLSKVQALMANQAHSFPETMSPSSCELEIGAFKKRLSDTHKFVRKQRLTTPNIGPIREDDQSKSSEA